MVHNPISTLFLAACACTLAAVPSAAQNEASMGSWGGVIDLPLIPVAAALMPRGEVLMWSAYLVDEFVGTTGQTFTAMFDPDSETSSDATISNTEHDMFCPGISMLANGRIVVTGGSTSEATSIYRYWKGTWEAGPDMNIARGYQSSTTLSTGEVFTLGGSWSGQDVGNRDGEVYTSAGGWRTLANVLSSTIETNDDRGTFCADNHGWFFGWSNGEVFHAGPAPAMHWFSTEGEGDTRAVGNRPDGQDSMCGNAVMYDAGKILTLGGALSYTESAGHNSASIITLSGTTVSSRSSGNLNQARGFPNSVVLPDGKVLVTGGMTTQIIFSDANAVYTAELWDPETEEFTELAAMATPRTYHSVSLLLKDGRVFVGGGGLCGDDCDVNHLNAEIFSPPYLFTDGGGLAERPTIDVNTGSIANGGSITVDSSESLQSIAIVRYGSVTHNINTDQRRIELCGPATASCAAGTSNDLQIPGDSGIALPGYWNVFGVNSAGVPSVGARLRISL